MKSTTWVIVLACACAVPAWPQTATRPASITAVGDATVSITPDLALVDVGVVTQAATAQEATLGNANQAGAVIGALKGLLGATANIKTISYSLSPVYNNPPAGQSATIIGYMVTNIVEVTLTDLAQVGKVIDTATQSGANRVQGVSFGLQDRNPATAQALKTAAARAKGQVDAIASGLNLHTGAVLHASQGVNAVSPVVFGAAAAAATPIETGLVVVQASVTLEVAIAP
jgi:uncharacterized protein YggE